MSSPKVFSGDRLYLSLSRSRAHSLLKLATHMAALVALWVNPIFWLPLQWALTLTLFTSLIHRAHNRNHLGKTLVVEQVVFRDETWSLGFSDGRWQEAELRSPLHVGYFFVVLSFKLKGEELNLVVARDACEKNTYRRLTVFIRHQGPKLLNLSLSSGA